MSRTGIILACILFFVSLSGQVFAQDRPRVAPWVFELKGGQFKPDLDLYEDFYDSDKVNYFAAALAYRPSDWYEFGGIWALNGTTYLSRLTVKYELP